MGNYTNREGTGYQNRRLGLCVLLGSLECVCYIWQLGAENHPSSFSFQVSLPSPIFLASCSVILSRPLSPSYLPQVFRYVAPGVLLLVPRGARCTFVLLSGPVWAFGGGHQPKAPGQFYCPAAFQSKKASVRRVFGRGWGGYGRGSGLSVTAAPLLPCPVVSCLSWRRGADKCTCLKSTPPGQMPISPQPSPRFYRNAACATHRCPFTLF